MRTIEIDDDIYSYLLSRIIQIGESASSILRRELKLNGQTEPKKDRPAAPTHELSAFLVNSPKIRYPVTRPINFSRS